MVLVTSVIVTQMADNADVAKLWKLRCPVPVAEELSQLRRVRFENIKSYDPDVDDGHVFL